MTSNLDRSLQKGVNIGRHQLILTRKEEYETV